MSRTKRTYHAAHLIRAYQRNIPDYLRFQEVLERLETEQLPQDCFQGLSKHGFGFSKSDAEPYPAINDALQASEQEGRLDVITINEFNIFQSMQRNATLFILKGREEYFAFLRADYGRGQVETFPVIATKGEYAQPHLLQQVFKRVQRAKNSK